jgi:hypothetical protein
MILAGLPANPKLHHYPDLGKCAKTSAIVYL